MPYDLVIRNAKVVSANGIFSSDIAVRDGQIEEVGTVGERGQTEVDASGLHALPGVIDTQVHFREPGATQKEDIESGTRAAACGGVTTVFEMPNTDPATTTAEALADKLSRAHNRAWCDYAFFVGATARNVDKLPDLEQLPGTPGVKVFVGSSTGTLLVDREEDLFRVLCAGARRCALHCEDEARLARRSELASIPGAVVEHPFLRDAEAALLATERVLRLARQAGRPVHILHVSTADEIPVIAAAKAAGQDVSAEVTPQHLFFSAPECYTRLGTFAQMNPPIRDEYHRQALWRGLTAGVFDCFGSDHAPHTLEEKALPYRGSPTGSPSGMPGVQTLLPVLLHFVQQGSLELTTLVEMACRAPATLYGLEAKGSIEPGFDADIVLCEVAAHRRLRRWDVQSKCGWSPYEGATLGEFPRAVYIRGNRVAENGKPVGQPTGRPAKFRWKQTTASKL
ncbi:MAG: dihydroorotase [Fimbriimonadaceae bacterium]